MKAYNFKKTQAWSMTMDGYGVDRKLKRAFNRAERGRAKKEIRKIVNKHTGQTLDSFLEEEGIKIKKREKC